MRAKLKSNAVKLTATLNLTLEINMLTKLLNWKTTLAGVVIAIGQYIASTADTDFSWATLLTVIPTAILGILSSDSSTDKES